MRLGEIIYKYRMEHGISQRQFAKMCDVSNGYISMLEKGVNPKTGENMIPTIPFVQKMSKTMGMTVDELIAISDDFEVDVSIEFPAMVRVHPSRKEIAMSWIREEATKEEKLQLLKELASLL